MQPRVGKIADLIVTQNIDETHHCSECGHEQPDSQQPERRASPELVGAFPKRQIGNESQDEAGDRKWNKHRMDGMSGDLSRGFGVWHRYLQRMRWHSFNIPLWRGFPAGLCVLSGR